MGFWMDVVMGVDGDRGTMLTMGLFHLVYGVVLGGSLGVIPSLV
jgi:hypothetical protein